MKGISFIAVNPKPNLNEILIGLKRERHRNVLLCFFEQDSESLFIALERFEILLCRFPMHGYFKEYQL